MRGNDPVCEARKKTCQVGGGAVTGAIFSGPLRQGGIVPRETVKKCLERPRDCSNEIIARGGYSFVRPIIDQYISDLRRQASGKYFRISPKLKNDLSRYFRFDLSLVKIAFDINTRHGQHITIGYEIYFTNRIDFATCAGFQLLAHELEHVDQYRRRGGIEPFMSEYVMKSVGQVLSRRSFNVHDYIDIESSAISKGSSVGCPNLVRGSPPHLMPGAVRPPQMGQTCSTPWGRCLMNVVAPFGSQCFCATNGGPIGGVVP
ncbi:DUF4157 domain-containing protein [Stappia sp. GBMRC 2046]|uniref:DUF4157 domain-containing protein n=1 Tax=Stappia sediminis TaxID=2692190 RepID=A0A7X3LQW8_9HYPH|nr:DUF4157 domain-containing protein [Stappia sediminis]